MVAQVKVKVKESEVISNGAVVADLLRRGIQAGDFVPGQRLVEADLMEDLNASRGAVRSSFAMLEADGLVEKVRHRGVRVRSLELDEALEIVEIRMLLESMCVAKAAVNASKSDREDLRRIAAEMQDAVSGSDLDLYSALNDQLHGAILTISGARMAPEIVKRLKIQQARFSIRLARQPNRPAVSLPEHLDIVEAICTADPERARAAMEKHLSSVYKATEQSFSSRA